MIILHGENTVGSRQKMSDLTASFDGEIVRLDGGTLTLTDLKQALESQPFLKAKRLVVMENLFSGRVKKEKELALAYLKKNALDHSFANLIVWEGSKIDGRRLTAFRQASIQLFSLSATIFKFLDAFFPENQKQVLFWLHQCLRQEPPEKIFYMLVRQIKLLIMAADLGTQGLNRLPDWQKSKLISQAQKIGIKKLIFIYQQLLAIDWRQKTGRASLPLAFELDLLTASL